MKTFTLFFILLIGGIAAFAQSPGDLVTGYSHDGILIVDWPDTSTYAYDITALPNEKLLVPGAYINDILGNGSICVSILDDEGEFVEFGNTCRGYEYDFAAFEMATSSVVLKDGNIMVAGMYGYGMNDYPFVLRLTPEGEPDTEFGTDGFYKNETITLHPTDMQVYYQGDDYYIIVAASDAIGQMLLMMLDDEGEIVTSFGTDGLLLLGGHMGMVRTIIVDNETGNLYGCGFISGGGSILFKIHLPEGTPDIDYGIDGIKSYTPADGFNGQTHALVFNPENNTLTTFGSYGHPDGDDDIFGYRIHADNATPDATFGTGGWGALRSPGSDEEIICAILQDDGKYYIGGVTDILGTRDFLLGRLIENGTGDTEFGTNGLIIQELPLDQMVFNLALNQSQTRLYTIGIQSGPDGAIVSTAHYTGYEKVIVGTHPVADEVIDIFPNPVRNRLIVQSSSTGKHEISVYNMTGDRVAESIQTGNRFELNFEALPPALYLIRVIDPQNRISTTKLVKE